MNIGLLLLRLVIGLTMIARGRLKLLARWGGYGLDETAPLMEGLGFYPGRRHALRAGLVEVTGGLLLAVGFLTPLGAALVASVMLVAAVSAHLKNGFFATNGGYEFNLVLGVAALSVAFTGPGRLSIDRLAGSVHDGSVWGVSTVILAGLGALVRLAQRRMLPIVENARTAA